MSGRGSMTLRKSQKNDFLGLENRFSGVVAAIKTFKKQAKSRRPTIQQLADQLCLPKSTIFDLIQAKPQKAPRALKTVKNVAIHVDAVKSGSSATRASKKTGVCARTAQRHTKSVRDKEKRRRKSKKRRWMVTPEEMDIYEATPKQIQAYARAAYLY